MVTTPSRHRVSVPESSGKRGRAAKATGAGAFLLRLWRLFEGSGRKDSGSSYYMILGSALALTAIGLMMVLSSSSVEAIADGTSSFSLFLRQGMWAVGGLVAMFVLSRFSLRMYQRLAWPALGVAIVLLFLVLLIGQEINGNKNWIQIGGFSMQPSEPAKLALALWCAAVLSRKATLLGNWRHAVVPVLPLGGLVIGMVLLGRDLGTAMILMLILAAALFFAGAPIRLLLLGGGAAAVVAAGMSLLSDNRSSRISAWLGTDCGAGLCDQANAGLFALASGGWLGVGLGQSRQKWNWIPEAHNDFIFTIIGEELGLVGTLVVVALFGLFAVAVMRMTLRQEDGFVRILSAALLVWIIGQAFINIGMVTGLLPVIGVPLPFISYGGSALTFTLAAVGVLLAFARPREAGTAAKPGRFRKYLSQRQSSPARESETAAP